MLRFPVGPDVVLRATLTHDGAEAFGGTKGEEVTIVGVEQAREDSPYLGRSIIASTGGLLASSGILALRFTKVVVLFPGKANDDRVAVLNQMLENRTPFASGQQVTVELARDILRLVDAMHVPTPEFVSPTDERIDRLLESLYAKRGILEPLADRLAPMLVGPWLPDSASTRPAWGRYPVSLHHWTDFEVKVTSLTEGEFDWWVRYKRANTNEEIYESGTAPYEQDARDAVDRYLRDKGFILLPARVG